MCGPRGLPGDTNMLYHNNGDGTFTDVSEKSGILKPGPRYSITAVSYDFDNDGWPDIYVAVDSQPSMLFRNNHDGTFTDIAVLAGCAYSDNGHEQAGMGVGGRRLRLRRLVRHLQDQLRRRHLQPLSQQRRRDLYRRHLFIRHRHQ